MSVIMDVIQEECNRLEALISQYDQKIAQYPKGSISAKKRGTQVYYYLVYRNENSRLKFEYLGKADSQKAEDTSRKVEERRRYELNRKQSIEKMKEIRKLLRAGKR